MNNVPDYMPVLSAGAHSSPSEGACVMEYVSLLAGEPWSDTPACTYPPLAVGAQIVNDWLLDSERHRLVPLIGRLFGTTLPVDARVFALRVARTVEHLNPAAKECNDVTERFLAVEVSEDELSAASSATATFSVSAAAYATYAAVAAAAANAGSAAYAATYAAVAAAKDMDSVEWLSSIIDIYDDLSGRTAHREVSGEELRVLAGAVGGVRETETTGVFA